MPLLILLLALPVLAQNAFPQWVEESWRTARYPNSEWYTGFARDNIKGQPNSETYQAIEKDAQNKLSESIQVKIQSSTAVQTSSRQNSLGESINTDYKQTTKTQTNAVLAKVDSKSYFDKKTSYIYGFAAVRKKDLAEFYTAKINGLFSFAENEFSIASQLAESGKRKNALDKIKAAEDSLSKVGYWEDLLNVVTSAAAYSKRSVEIRQKINTAKIAFENGTAIYLDISGSEYLAEKLGAVMQEKGCNCFIAENADEANYTITVNAKLNRCNQADFGEVYCFANANVSMRNPKTKKNISVEIPEAKGAWVNGNSEKATEESFKELAANIAQKLVKEMEK
ncbi:MAG: hypothetical protein LBQ76_06120 [Candidatus Fibromonas sp.]|jgi:hypothetical protein|nr:hypothetical protein [Candidatus Fibromonas sp.]